MRSTTSQWVLRVCHSLFYVAVVSRRTVAAFEVWAKDSTHVKTMATDRVMAGTSAMHVFAHTLDTVAFYRMILETFRRWRDDSLRLRIQMLGENPHPLRHVQTTLTVMLPLSQQACSARCVTPCGCSGPWTRPTCGSSSSSSACWRS